MPIIPLISSDTVGPLGVKHLPRLWLKTLLHTVGELPPGYKDIRPGFDLMVLEGLRLDPETVREYIVRNRPGYLQFENWIRDREEADISPENIERVNAIVVSRQKSGDSRKRMLEENGLSEDCGIADSIMLNNLDDWREIHQSVTE
ncbi:MAG: DUF5069 domain-containing protein [Verrucomicrobiales bacterium]|nr:DUF5069 domain-containing protein [Verrucomicrobiales bacterium]